MHIKIKELILIFISVIVASSLTAYATVRYNSENITFSPSNSNWAVNNTNNALNDLYTYIYSGNAMADNILLNKTAVANGELLTGTMPNNGSINQTIEPGNAYTIPEGYHSGTGVITASNKFVSTPVITNLNDGTYFKDGVCQKNGLYSVYIGLSGNGSSNSIAIVDLSLYIDNVRYNSVGVGSVGIRNPSTSITAIQYIEKGDVIKVETYVSSCTQNPLAYRIQPIYID